jgi:hypothetical protein
MAVINRSGGCCTNVAHRISAGSKRADSTVHREWRLQQGRISILSRISALPPRFLPFEPISDLVAELGYLVALRIGEHHRLVAGPFEPGHHGFLRLGYEAESSLVCGRVGTRLDRVEERERGL